MSLERLQQFVNEANASNSILDKKVVIERFEDCKPYWKLVYDTINYQFNVTSKNILKLKSLGTISDYSVSIQQLLMDLNDGVYTGHDAIKAVNTFISQNPQYEDLVYCMIDRNLKTRTDSKLINDVFPGTIPEFEVALAESYDDKTAKVVTFDGNWLCSRKLDGCRCLAIIDGDGNIKMMSRQGKEFLVLQKLIDNLKTLGLTNFVLDGEICIVDENGDEDFTSIMKEIRRKDHTIERPKYIIFDGLPLSDFEAKYSSVPLINRLINLLNIIPKNNPYFSLLHQKRLNSKEEFDAFRKRAADGGWEGLILRKNAAYQGKRSKDMLKVKEFIDDEYVVTNVTMGPFRHIDNITGLEVETELLSRVEIIHKGNPVGVGSGFSLDQRKYYHQNPHEIIGKTITVRYFEESNDETGKLSLRFPTVKHIHENGRDT